MHVRPLYPIPAHTSTDWLSIANHLFVLGSCGYLIGNFYRSIVGDTLNARMSADVENALFVTLATLFVVDAVLYYKSMFVAVWPVRRSRVAVEAEEAERLRDEAEEEEDDAEDEVRALPWLSMRNLAQRIRSISGASISTTETQEDDITPGLSPSSSDGWSDTTAGTVTASHSAASDLTSSSAAYTLHVDSVQSAQSLSINDAGAVAVPAGGAAQEHEDLVVDPTYSALLPLRSAGLGEIVNIVASLVALSSAVLPFFASYLTDPALPHHRAVNLTPKYQLILDNGSMFLWFIDSLIYMHAWRHSLPAHYPGIKPGYCQPTHPYFYANLLNLLASTVYMASVVYGFFWTHSEREWRDEDRDERRRVQTLQRTLALGGDVLYLLCALVMEVAWYVDKCNDEVTTLKRRSRRERRQQRQRLRERQERKQTVASIGDVQPAISSPTTDTFHSALLGDDTDRQQPVA